MIILVLSSFFLLLVLLFSSFISIFIELDIEKIERKLYTNKQFSIEDYKRISLLSLSVLNIICYELMGLININLEKFLFIYSISFHPYAIQELSQLLLISIIIIIISLFNTVGYLLGNRYPNWILDNFSGSFLMTASILSFFYIIFRDLVVFVLSIKD